ncbi:SDR family oxidoreductase [Thermoactinospora rubra]|uniref:SDR family oxidoreductase n=1 Tax=Thermoactinospora rubra TaxID=1088767 RepID=UPI000A119C0A|nr:SDR family oxidoreductase [Thermoactinospora rubra]
MAERPTALVTGASRGVGEAVARALAPTHRLILGGRDRTRLEKLAAELPEARAWPVELTAVTERDVAGVDLLDVLVHSAGTVRLGRVADTPAQVWRDTMEVNVVAVAELTRLLLPALRAAGGHVVCVNSGSGQRANPGWASYAASKFALRAFADALRLEEPSLRVTTVYPGRVDTDMQRSVREQEGGPYEPEKYLQAETVARAIVAAVTAGPDAHLTELTLRPRSGPVS